MKFSGESLKNRLKSYVCEAAKGINITHKLDYDKHEILLNDNIRLASCKKEPETVEWIETFKKEDIIFDVGANVGAYSLIMGKYGKKVYAFEPSAFTFNTLVKNIYTNKAFNVVPFNMALASRKKIATFIYSSTVPGTSSHGLESNFGDNSYQQDMLVYDIDGLVKDFNLEYPNHIKIDVDGGEFEILEGARETMSRKEFKSLMVEADEADEKMFRYLENLGLAQKEVTEIGHEERHNYFFYKKQDV